MKVRGEDSYPPALLPSHAPTLSRIPFHASLIHKGLSIDGDDETPSVSIGPFVSDMDALEREREQHETRRLLYVAMTRARDRLYLSSALKDGVLRPGVLSLAEVLPDSLKAVFTSAGTPTRRVPTSKLALDQTECQRALCEDPPVDLDAFAWRRRVQEKRPWSETGGHADTTEAAERAQGAHVTSPFKVW